MTKIGFAVDRGGTFTDVCVFYPNGKTRVLKLLSEDPENYADAPTEAIRRVLEEGNKRRDSEGELIPTENIAWIRMGTTGFKDLLFIGNQSRPRIFDFDIRIPEVLYSDVIEIDERVIPSNQKCEMKEIGEEAMATNGQKILVERSLNDEELRVSLEEIKSNGFHSLAVLFLHSYIYPAHELAVERLAKAIGFKNISLSHKAMPMIKAVPRGFTVCADAYLTPKIAEIEIN
ncbi:unnamed protein product, partial [Mesorhabditis belari]|uniref:Hydantoinase/oxoprolinase N-terminal domain-containing protein n=1 Tax=Mesorhabditis belari TaxID=2138241 RepID=A0AAF3F9F7_9BILA